MTKHRRSLLAITFIAFSLFCGRVFALENADRPVSATPIAVHWRPSKSELTYVRQSSAGGLIRDVLISYDVNAGVEKTLYDPTAGDAPNVDRGRVTVRGYVWSPAGDALLVNHLHDLWIVPVPNGQPRQLTRDEIDEELPVFSPDGGRIAFVKKNNLFTVDVANGTVTQLTFDGSENILNGKLDWVYGEEFEDANPSGRSFAWSPDGKAIAFLRLDQSKVPEYPVVDFLQTHPTVTLQRYPKSGDANSAPTLCVVNVDAAAPRVVQMPLPPGVEYVIPELTWTPDSKAVAAMTLNRAQNELTLVAWQPASGETRVLLQEKDSAWINIYSGPRFLRNAASAGNFIWLSERDGFLHAYLYDSSGKLVRQLTHGDWMFAPSAARGGGSPPVEIDAAEEYIYFCATEKDPRERHIYRARIDGEGKGVERLSKEAGTHSLKLSPDGKFLTDSFSSIEQPPTIRVIKADGTTVATLYKSGGRMRKASAEFHEVTAPDGVKLYGRLIKPGNFDPNKKYPVIVDVYGGPSIQIVRNSWGGDDWDDQRLAQEGYLVWKMDNRGSFGRGHDWEKVIFKNMGEKELADQLAGVEYLKKMPFVDPERFGIHGWSYGGYMTLYTLTHAPNAFKCGVAGAPVTDWRFYDTIYTERYMRTPKENPEGYISSSPLAAAGKLTAKLLIVHGTSDDNVHLQNTMNFLDALTQKGRPYELQIQPGQKHGFRGERAWQYYSDRMLDFFKRNL